jgi:hypothetical protein
VRPGKTSGDGSSARMERGRAGRLGWRAALARGRAGAGHTGAGESWRTASERGQAEVRGSGIGTALEQTWREQERAGTGVDAARAGGVTLTREWHTSQAALERFTDGAGANVSGAERVTRTCA